jgi:hypothetical protein
MKAKIKSYYFHEEHKCIFTAFLAKFVGNRSWLRAAPSVSVFTGFAAVHAVMCTQISCVSAHV